MSISFNPPLGDTVHVLSSSLHPQTLSAVLSFTAKLSIWEYENLLRKNGRLQVWSDFPVQGSCNGNWNEWEFKEQDAWSLTSQLSGAHTIPLSRSRSSTDINDKILYLPIYLPPSGIKHFSFTYRIFYSSGEITWLGAFGQNGSIVLESSNSNPFADLALENGSTFDQRRRARVWEINEGSKGVAVAKIDLAQFQIWALGKDNFANGLKKASLFFLLPHLHSSSVILQPTYAFAASPDLYMSFDDNGSLTVSGSGSLLLQINELHMEARPFFEQLISHCGLDSWVILATDSQTETVAIASASRSPIRSVIIPLWRSPHQQPSLCLDSINLKTAMANSNTKEFAVCPISMHEIYTFVVDGTNKDQANKIILQVDSAETDFVIGPVYRQRASSQRTWATVVLTPHWIVSTPTVSTVIISLPTPPPSPRMNSSPLESVPILIDNPPTLTANPNKVEPLAMLTTFFSSIKSVFEILWKFFVRLWRKIGAPSPTPDGESGHLEIETRRDETNQQLGPCDRDSSIIMNEPAIKKLSTRVLDSGNDALSPKLLFGELPESDLVAHKTFIDVLLFSTGCFDGCTTPPKAEELEQVIRFSDASSSRCKVTEAIEQVHNFSSEEDQSHGQIKNIGYLLQFELEWSQE